MCVLLDMYEERGEARGKELGIKQGISQGISEINSLNQHLLADNRMDDMRKSMCDIEFQKKLMKEYNIGV